MEYGIFTGLEELLRKLEELSLKPTVVDNCDAQDGSSISPLAEDSPKKVLPIPSLVVDPPPVSTDPAMSMEIGQGSHSEDTSSISDSPLDEAFCFYATYVGPTKSVTPEHNEVPAFDSSHQTRGIPIELGEYV